MQRHEEVPGAMLCEMLTGDPPHTGSLAQQVIMKIVTEPAAPVTSLRKSAPPVHRERRHFIARTSRSGVGIPGDGTNRRDPAESLGRGRLLGLCLGSVCNLDPRGSSERLPTQRRHLTRPGRDLDSRGGPDTSAQGGGVACSSPKPLAPRSRPGSHPPLPVICCVSAGTRPRSRA